MSTAHVTAAWLYEIAFMQTIDSPTCEDHMKAVTNELFYAFGTVMREEAEEARLMAERQASEAKLQEEQRITAERLSARALLKAFIERYGNREEFASVTAAIRDYFGKSSGRAGG